MIIYFLKVAGTEYVKIGRTKNMFHRFRGLQSASPFTLEIIREIDGGAHIETALHKAFASYRIRGEWFTFCDEMLTWQSVEEPACEVLEELIDVDVPEDTSPWITLENVLTIIHSRVEDLGTQRAVAKAFDISCAYLSEILKGDKEPGEKILIPLGLERVISYQQRGNGK